MRKKLCHCRLNVLSAAETGAEICEMCANFMRGHVINAELACKAVIRMAQVSLCIAKSVILRRWPRKYCASFSCVVK